MDSSRADSEAQALISELAAILRPVRDKVTLIGATACNFWSEPRFTKDVDFTVVADSAVIEQIKAGLVADGYEIERSQDHGDPSGPDFVRFVKPGTRKIVEFQAAKTPFQVLTIQRAAILDIDQPFPVATREDLIVMKLIANRRQDLVDATTLALSADIDWQYIADWAAIWDVSARVEQLRAEVNRELERIAGLEHR